MPVHGRSLLGAFLLAAFITVCVGWLFHGVGNPVSWWGYPLVFVVFLVLVYAVARLLLNPDRRAEPPRSYDISIED